MSKQCDVCNTINYDAANHCSHCGYEFPDKELSEEDKLRNELFQAKETIHGLNRALAELQKNGASFEETQRVIADYKAKLAKEKQENSKYVSLFSEKDSELTIAVKEKSIYRVLLIFFLLISLVLVIGLIDLKLETDKRITKLNIEIFSLKSEKEQLRDIKNYKYVVNKDIAFFYNSSSYLKRGYVVFMALEPQRNGWALVNYTNNDGSYSCGWMKISNLSKYE